MFIRENVTIIGIVRLHFPQMDRWHCIAESPLGPLTLVANASGLCGIYFEDHQHPPRYTGEAIPDDPVLLETATQLDQFFQSARRKFQLPLMPEGTEFQRQVWNVLQELEYGETTTYLKIAKRLDNPAAVRAVGAAVGQNPISIVIPCHRVLGSNGDLTGFAGGLQRKQWLLNHESARQGSLF
jgi:methylated-DNA-[protein]-cysteine S-methyltransferase